MNLGITLQLVGCDGVTNCLGVVTGTNEVPHGNAHTCSTAVGAAAIGSCLLLLGFAPTVPTRCMEDMAARESDNAFAITVRLAAKRALLIRSLVDDGEIEIVYLHRLWRLWRFWVHDLVQPISILWAKVDDRYMFRNLVERRSVDVSRRSGWSDRD